MSTEIAVPLVSHVTYDGINVPFANGEERERVSGLESQRKQLDNQNRELSQKLLATQTERIDRFMEKATVALGLNAEQSKEIKPLFLRFLRNLSDLKGVDIVQKAQDESMNNLLFTLFGGFVGAILINDSKRQNQTQVINSRRNLDRFESTVMEKLNLKEEGKPEIRQKMLSFLEKESPELAKSYKALAEVKVFDPLYGVMTWLSNALGGKENLKSIVKDVKKDLDHLAPSIVSSVISGDDNKVKECGEQAMKRLSQKYAPTMNQVKDAAKVLLEPESLSKIVKTSIEAASPAIKSKLV